MGAQLDTSVGRLTSGSFSRLATPLAVSIALPPPMPTRNAGENGAMAAARWFIACCVHAPPNGRAASIVMPEPSSAAVRAGRPFSIAVTPPITANVSPSGLHSAGKRAYTPRPKQKRGRVMMSVVYIISAAPAV